MIADLLLLLALIVSIVPVGVALVRWRAAVRGIDLVGYGTAAGVLVQGMFGLGVALFPSLRTLLLIIDLGSVVGAILFLWRVQTIRQIGAALPRPMMFSLGIWLAFVVACVGITHLEVNLPAELPDWRYIFKKPTLNVKLQYLTNSPADNVIPSIVSEFLLRGISFERERPILPGNEVSNRTILLPLVTLPFRAAIAPPPPRAEPLGTFEFVGRRWPAVEKLYDERAYRQVLVIGIFLNSLLLLGLLVFFQGRSADPFILPAATILCATNPYLIFQTIFIWPKALAGFFLLLTWHALRKRWHPSIIGLSASLAYHSHPYAGIFAVGVGLCYLWEWWRGRASLCAAVIFASVFIAAIAPWLLWTHAILHLSSDLLWQNVAGPATAEALANPMAFIWMRLKNLFELMAPTVFAIYPLKLAGLADVAQASLPATVGLVLIIPALNGAVAAARRQPLYLLLIAFPALFIVLLFSYFARPILHGFQPIVGALVFCGVATLRANCHPPWFWSALALQLLINASLLELYGFVTGVHFPLAAYAQ